MFCNYCGKTNPDDASFCRGCGKQISHVPGAASNAPHAAPQPTQPLTPLSPTIQLTRPTEPAEPVRVAIPAVGPTSGTTAAPVPAVRPAPKWSLGRSVILMAPVALVLTYPYRDGATICEATRHEVAQQVPFSVDLLAARHPIAVGLLRSALNGDGAIDRFAQDYYVSQMASSNPGSVSCYVSYYSILFNKDRFRTSIADWFEKQLNLN